MPVLFSRSAFNICFLFFAASDDVVILRRILYFYYDGVRPVSAQRASFDTVLYAFAIFIFINLCTLLRLILLLSISIALVHTGAPYRRSGSIAPVYIV